MRPVTSSEQQLQLLKSKDKGNIGLGLLHGWVFFYISKLELKVFIWERGEETAEGRNIRGKLVKGKGKREEAI